MRLDIISSSEIKQFNTFIFDSIVIDFVIGHHEPFMIVIYRLIPLEVYPDHLCC